MENNLLIFLVRIPLTVSVSMTEENDEKSWIKGISVNKLNCDDKEIPAMYPDLTI